VKRATGAETQEKIIQAALALFVRKGYHGSSITDIMKQVGLTKGCFYAHFQSKGELLLRIIDVHKQKYISEMIRVANACQGSALEKLNRIISFSSQFAYDNQNLCIFLTFLSTELNADADFELMLKAVYRDYQNFVSAIIRQGINQGLIDKDTDPNLAALTFMAVHDGVLHQWVLNRHVMDPKQYVQTFRKILLYGLVSENGRRTYQP
jgi:AcrR family transcriptional regulator